LSFTDILIIFGASYAFGLLCGYKEWWTLFWVVAIAWGNAMIFLGLLAAFLNMTAPENIIELAARMGAGILLGLWIGQRRANRRTRRK